MLKVDLIAVGTRPPAWVQTGIEQYSSRMKRDCQFAIKEIKTSDRTRSTSTKKHKAIEGEAMLKAVVPGARIIALDVGGRNWSTEKLAANFVNWSQMTNHFQFLIGGPDGLSSQCLDAADDVWSLSNLIFPHFLVRVMLAEQIYRVLMLNANHPYHK